MASELAAVWAGIGSRWERNRGSALETQTTATERDSDCGLGSRYRASAGPGRKPGPSTPPEARVGSCAGLLRGGWRRGLAGGAGGKRLRPQGPGGGGRPPPTARGVCSPSPPAAQRSQRRPQLKALETRRRRLTSAL